jgi:hypothetical protein
MEKFFVAAELIMYDMSESVEHLEMYALAHGINASSLTFLFTPSISSQSDSKTYMNVDIFSLKKGDFERFTLKLSNPRILQNEKS